MKLLLKHLARSIGKKPLQPFILILTLTLSIATSIFAFTIDDMMDDDARVAHAIKYGNADLMVRVGNSSESRFLFVDDVTDVLGESARAVGCYELPLILNGTEDTTVAMATEFERVSDVFEIDFSDYGKVTKGSVSDVAFISSDFAQKKGLSVGDTLEVETMGYFKTYRIEGISDHPFLASYDVMVDLSSVVRAFAENSLLFATIGDDFKPCGKIYIDIDRCEGMKKEDAVALLRADPRFSEKIFDDLLDAETRQSSGGALDIVVNFSVALASLLSAVISFCCIYILANERAEENLILSYSGAGPGLLGVMQYAEVVFYWMISIPLGIATSIPITRIIALFVNLQYTEVSIQPLTVLKSTLIIFAVCLLTTTFFIIMGKRIKRTGASQTTIKAEWSVGLLLVIAVLFVLMYVTPAEIRLVLYVVTVAAVVALIFLATPMLLRWITSAMERCMKDTQKPFAIAFRYALKNIRSLKLLHNIARLCALIVTIILTIGLVFACAEGCFTVATDLDADYAVLNATDRCYQKTQSCESVDAVYRSYLDQCKMGSVISADDFSVFGDSLSIESELTGNQAVISAGIAHRTNIKVGDHFWLEHNGMVYELVIVEIARVGANFIAVNCEDIGMPYNMLLVKGKDGITQAELLADLSQATSSELASIVSIESLFEQLIRTMETYVNAGKILLYVFLTFALIGVIDTFYESLRARREEFGFYRLAGMNQGNLRFMKVSELAVTVMIGVLVGIGAFIISAFAVNRGMSGKGVEVFYGVKQLLG